MSISHDLEDRAAELALLKYTIKNTRCALTQSPPHTWDEANLTMPWSHRQQPVPKFEQGKTRGKKQHAPHPRAKNGVTPKRSLAAPDATDKGRSRDVADEKTGADSLGCSCEEGLFGRRKHLARDGCSISSSSEGATLSFDRLGDYLRTRRHINSSANTSEDPTLQGREEIPLADLLSQTTLPETNPKASRDHKEPAPMLQTRRPSITELVPDVSQSPSMRMRSSRQLSYSRNLEAESVVKFAFQGSQADLDSSVLSAKLDPLQLQVLDTRTMQLEMSQPVHRRSGLGSNVPAKKGARAAKSRKTKDQSRSERGESMSAVLLRHCLPETGMSMRAVHSASDVQDTSLKPFQTMHGPSGSSVYFDARTGTVFPPIPQGRQRTVSIPSNHHHGRKHDKSKERQPAHQFNSIPPTGLLPKITGQRCYGNNALSSTSNPGKTYHNAPTVPHAL